MPVSCLIETVHGQSSPWMRKKSDVSILLALEKDWLIKNKFTVLWAKFTICCFLSYCSPAFPAPLWRETWHTRKKNYSGGDETDLWQTKAFETRERFRSFYLTMHCAYSCAVVLLLQGQVCINYFNVGHLRLSWMGWRAEIPQPVLPDREERETSKWAYEKKAKTSNFSDHGKKKEEIFTLCTHTDITLNPEMYCIVSFYVLLVLYVMILFLLFYSLVKAS